MKDFLKDFMVSGMTALVFGFLVFEMGAPKYFWLAFEILIFQITYGLRLIIRTLKNRYN